jgi:hypothetical protein
MPDSPPPMSLCRFVTLSVVVVVACQTATFSPSSAAAQDASSGPATSTLQIQFIDSATGYGLQPQTVTLQRQQPDALESRLDAWQISRSGHAAVSLEQGSHSITAAESDHMPMSGQIEVSESNPCRIRFLLDPLVPPRELQPDYVASLHRDNAMVILGFVVDDDSGEPLANVRVTSTPSGAGTTTDARGFFQIYVPVQDDSAAQSSAANLAFEKAGYQTEDHQYLELWPRGDWTYRVRLIPGTGRQVVDERQFRRRFSPAQTATAQQPATAAPAIAKPPTGTLLPLDNPIPQATAATNSTIRVPRNIRVLEQNGTTIDYVSLDYYCKHVLPAEWIAGWAAYTGGSNSLNAGAVALRTYAIGYINNPKTSTYDICATTSCQVYGTTTSSYSDTAVNFTANYVEINSSGTIPSGLTEYSAEDNSLANSCGDGFTEPSTTGPVCLYDPVCAGEARNGHGRGMCQWGTAKWATGLKFPGNSTSDHSTLNGYPRRDWLWICQHYYPTLTLVKGAPLMVGDDIKALTTLNVRACADGSITNGTGCGVVASKSAGATGTIIGGPTVVTNDGGGFTWYQIQWSDSTVGWSVENYLERLFTLPTAPSTLVASPAATNQINLAWTDTSGGVATGFRIERAIASTGPWLQINTTASGLTNYSDKALPLGSTWYYRVRAFNAGGNSSYSNIASATTSNTPPTLASIPAQTILETAVLTLTNTAAAADFVQLLTDFESFMTETANGVVMFRDPTNSSSTSAFLAATPDLAAISDVFPASGNPSTRVLRLNFSFNSSSNPWLRLTTSNAATFPNPVIDFTRKLRLSVYCDKAIQMAVGCRETGTAPGTAIGSNGGTTGAIEWAGVTNTAGTAPMPTRTVAAGIWTALTFDLPNEPIRSFSGGNGVLPASLGVLEHLAIVPAGGTGVYNVYLDNLAVVAPRTLSYSLAAGAPTNATINPTNGVFTWIPTDAQGPSTNTLSVIVTDNSSPPLSDTKTFTITVLPRPTIQPQSLTNGNITLTWTAVPNATYRVQFKSNLNDPAWTDLSPDITAVAQTASITNSLSAPQSFYRVLVVNY